MFTTLRTIVLKEAGTAAIVVLVAVGAFGVGKLSAIQSKKEPISVEYATDYSLSSTTPVAPSKPSPIPTSSLGASAILSQPSTKGAVVASKTSRLYHLPTCPGAKRIMEQNKVWYTSIEEAKAAGLSPASNCKGLK